MKYTITSSENYAARVIEVTQLTKLEGLDNLRGIYIDGQLALVSKSIELGTKLVVFPAESQLSSVFAAWHNLYRPSVNLNTDPTVETGYLEKKARVRAIKFRGYVSSALAIPAEGWADDAPVGTLFDTIDGVQISRKYVVPVKQGSRPAPAQEKAWKRFDSKWMPEHIDTSNYFRFGDRIPEDAFVTVTQKLHGTSARFGYTKVNRKLTWIQKVAQKLGIPVQTHEFDYVFGSRRVIKGGTNQDHWYGSDIWREVGARYNNQIPKNVVVYGELVGYKPDTSTPIQKNYTYNELTGNAGFYVYRVAVVADDGGIYDLSWNGVKEFCNQQGFAHVPELWQGFKRDLDIDQFIDVDLPHPAVPLSPDSPCDEGVCVRVEGVLPQIYKAKSPIFLEHETRILDTEEEVLD